MAKEIQPLEKNETWTLQDLAHGKKSISCKWLHWVKYNSNGSVQQFKGRLVIRGDHQVEGFDYNETFALVVKMTSVRCFLSVAVSKGWSCLNWTSATLSCMGIWMRRYTSCYLLVLLEALPLGCADPRNLFMAFVMPCNSGLPNLSPISMSTDLFSPTQVTHSLLTRKGKFSWPYLYMLTILYWLAMILLHVVSLRTSSKHVLA